MNTINANDYPQLLLLTWDRQDKTMTEEEALALYELKSKWIVVDEMDKNERALFDRLVATYGNGVFNG